MTIPNLFKMRFQTHMEAQSDTAEVLLYGEIISDMPQDCKWSTEDKSAADFDKAIKEVKEQGAKNIKVRINSPGGLLTEAAAMRAILCNAGFDKIHISVEGICASAATLIATIPGAYVEISDCSEYMIHSPRLLSYGTAAELLNDAETLRKQEETVCSIYAKRTGQDVDQIRAWMEAETWFTAEEAVKNGFADKVANSGNEKTTPQVYMSHSMMCAMRTAYHNVPERIAEMKEEAPLNIDRTEAPKNAADANTQIVEEETTMEIKELTLEQLKDANPALYESVMNAGSTMERQRIQEIDELTPMGYEKVAEDAKASGMSAIDYHKQIVKMQKEKAATFLADRREETASAKEVGRGEEEIDVKPDHVEMTATDIANFAKSYTTHVDGNMF